MTARLTVSPAPAPLEEYATPFDDLFSRANQRQAFRRYLEGLLLFPAATLSTALFQGCGALSVALFFARYATSSYYMFGVAVLLAALELRLGPDFVP